MKQEEKENMVRYLLHLLRLGVHRSFLNDYKDIDQKTMKKAIKSNLKYLMENT